ncbi:hypothetical protein [Sedimenticola selenatireducens]|uniref:Uncharacterized protein n=1 Tax=Sedimenticola selenatireducens TaxID=191960 RepID=A0A2N6D176_9GAMM|nr:hypothetical protein [Sedimenticola selenatireducens]PLX63441.1 MAG: hypothetical protein C0630_00595 [Sedimenticola selenatireducens]
MFVVDDPVLALIVRFVATERDLDVTDGEFLQRQVESMERYLERYPEQEHGEKAIEWIAEYAAQYRDRWQKQVVTQQAGETRCMDCPMNILGEESYCQIHYQWRQLLKRYARDEMSSSEYVKAALGMLQEHKQELKVRKEHEAEGLRQLKAYRDARNQPL